MDFPARYPGGPESSIAVGRGWGWGWKSRFLLGIVGCELLCRGVELVREGRVLHSGVCSLSGISVVGRERNGPVGIRCKVEIATGQRKR